VLVSALKAGLQFIVQLHEGVGPGLEGLFVDHGQT